MKAANGANTMKEGDMGTVKPPTLNSRAPDSVPTGFGSPGLINKPTEVTNGEAGATTYNHCDPFTNCFLLLGRP
jgi:hypothetical protein